MAELEQKDVAAFDVVWKGVRTDGAYVEAGENDNLIVQKLEANPKAFGVFGYSFLEENKKAIKAASIEGDQPAYDSIANGNYKGSRVLFFYMKKAHLGLVPGMVEYITEFTSDKAIGADGYLLDKGLVALKTCDAELSAANTLTLPNLDGEFLK